METSDFFARLLVASRNMTFDALAQEIAQRLAELRRSGAAGGVSPELHRVCKQLRETLWEKRTIPEEEPTRPALYRPNLQELEELERNLKRRVAFYKKLPPPPTDRQILAEQELLGVQEDIAAVPKTMPIWEEFDRQLQAYRENRPSQLARANHERRLLRDIQRDIDRLHNVAVALPVAKKLDWVLLPPAERTLDAVIAHFQRLEREEKIPGVDYTRITRIASLAPSEVYIGQDEWEGYVVFVFGDNQRVILDCPQVGNAIYVLKQNWRELTKHSKRDLRECFSDRIQRVVHSANWFERVKATIDADRTGDESASRRAPRR